MGRSLDIDIRIGDEALFHRRFTRFISDLADLSPAFEDMADSFRRFMAEGFDSEGAATGDRWTPLSTAYAAWKARRYPGKAILQREGILLESLTGGAGEIRVITDRHLAVGTAVPYALYHQYGTRTGLPARPVIRLSEDMKRDWMRIMHRYLAQAVAGRKVAL